MGLPKPNTETVVVDLGVFGEIECEVDFFYSPAERQTYDHPGCDESFEIMCIRVGGVNIEAQIQDSRIEEIIYALKDARND